MQHRKLSLVLLGELKRNEGWREDQQGGCICPHTNDSLILQQRITQHCKITITQLEIRKKERINKNMNIQDSPGGPVVKIPCSQYREPRFLY